MCNGDFGMYRVMPWALPPIQGGQENNVISQDPVISHGTVYVTGYASNPTSMKAYINVKLQNVVYANKDLIKSISSDFKPDSSGMTISYRNTADKYLTGTFIISSTNVNITSVNDGDLWIQYVLNVSSGPGSWNSSGLPDTEAIGYSISKFTLYDSNGEVLQEIAL